jgi:hypothetical protein
MIGELVIQKVTLDEMLRIQEIEIQWKIGEDRDGNAREAEERKLNVIEEHNGETVLPCLTVILN